MTEEKKAEENMEKAKAEEKKEESRERRSNSSCSDPLCPFHGSRKLKLRGRVFRGKVVRKFPKRVCIEFERTAYVSKYERYMKKKTKLHARLPDCLADKINIGDYIEIKECRQISKIINFVVIRKIEKEISE